MEMRKTWSRDIAGRTLTIETGWWAKQANGAVTVRYGETQIMATAVMSKGMGFAKGYFPLMVDYEERYYAAGKIKGSRFIKREGRPSDEAVLTGRVVDRTIRPLFNMRMRNDVQVVVAAQSFDGDNDPDILGVIAASAALHTSDIPWGGPVAAVRVGLIDEQVVINPTKEQLEGSTLNLTVAGTAHKINMIETEGQEVPEEDILRAFEAGHKVVAEIAGFIEEIRAEVGKEKAEPTLLAASDEVEALMREKSLASGLEEALYGTKEEIKVKTSAAKETAKNAIIESLGEGIDEVDLFDDVFEQVFDEVADDIVHKNILDGEKRPDGRRLDEVRPITCEVGVLPRPHGTGVFTRGETQVLTVTTLGAPGDHQIIDTMEVDVKKHYIHHYNFPAYCVGEVRPMRGPGRREIGHGALAEKALRPVVPAREDFPYTVLLVSEVMESNGSSSMASTCGSTLSLMHAGVPIKAPVSGIAMGVIIGDGSFKILSDIQGAEDHYGDMDFKVAGTSAGITAMQMDVKVDGIDFEMLKAALEQAKQGRAHILGEMLGVIAEPSPELSPYAPSIITMQIDPEKIRDVIGKGGETINKIIDETGASIDIEDDGSVFITAPDTDGGARAQKWIENLTKSIEVGEIYEGEVVRIMDFGAFVQVLPGQDGLVHISEMAHERVATVGDVVKIGDKVKVLVKEIDEKGRVNLSMKALIKKEDQQ